MLAHFNEYDLQKARGEDMRRTSEQNAQAQELSPRPPFYASTLAGVGNVLVGIGSKLQEQYTVEERYSSPSLSADLR